jgi:hypothetical protein
LAQCAIAAAFQSSAMCSMRPTKSSCTGVPG